MTSAPEVSTVSSELQWLIDNPEFAERPATLTEFLGDDYLGIEKGVRKSIRDILADIMGHDVQNDRPTAYELAMFTGGIGIGKTTVAAIVLPYLAHWCLCLKDPQRFFGLLPGTRIAFMMMSTSSTQAKEVLFADVKARLIFSPWFKKYPWDPSFKNQIRFEKDIWIVPGDSAETTFEGYNILGGILDEADSHKVTKSKDYAEQGFETIFNRMSSRFEDRGFLLVIGQMKSATGFAAKKYEELKNMDGAYTARLTIWESRGDEYYADKNGNVEKFYYDRDRKQIVPRAVVSRMGVTPNLLHIPEIYRDQFETNPEKALKDLAGYPPKVTDPFISMVHKIHHCRDRWIEHNGPTSPVKADGRLENWFHAPNTIKRVAHIDLAYSGNGDALGFAMGHIPEVTEVDGELKPYISIDMLLRMTAAPGQEIHLGDIRRLIYSLHDDLGFKLELITMDGFQSKDTEQQLQRRRFGVDYVSVDKKILPYHDLREAIYENRIEFPPYVTRLDYTSNKEVEIAVKELSELMDLGGKIDHPADGSKDVADALAGVTTTLIGNRRYHRKNRRSAWHQVGAQPPDRMNHRLQSDIPSEHRTFTGGIGFSAPVPPKSIGDKR